MSTKKLLFIIAASVFTGLGIVAGSLVSLLVGLSLAYYGIEKIKE